MTRDAAGPLASLKILDLSTVIAGPWSSTLLADLGAEVLKVEIPGTGDALRALPPHKDWGPLWWKVTNRGKRGITLDLRREEGREILGRLLPDYDVLVENFRPGTLDKWGITREWLHGINERLTILRLTGFGQTGPYRSKPGFARVFEAMTGFTNICGEADRPPLHLGFPIADAIGGLFGSIDILAALYHRQATGEKKGQEIDCSMMEAMFRVLDFLPIEYDRLGVRLLGVNSDNPQDVRERVWRRLATDLRPRHLEGVRHVLPFDRLPDVVEDLIARRNRSRAVIALQDFS